MNRRVVIEMRGSSSSWQETRSAPDWVKLGLFEGGNNIGSTIRHTYDDGSFTEWRVCIK